MCDKIQSENEANPQEQAVKQHPQLPPEAPQHAPLTALPKAYPPLSKTEKRVCAFLLARMTELQVAQTLERSPNTVHVHVRNIYRKLGIRSRQELHDLPREEPEVTKSEPAGR